MDPIIAAIAALVGYLLGSISFLRIVSRLIALGLNIREGVETDIPGVFLLD